MYKIQRFKKNEALKNLKQLVELYFNAFTTGKYAQFMTLEQVENNLLNLPTESKFLLALAENEPVGMLIDYPLQILDKKFKGLKNSVYIAELLVNEKHQGKGLGKKLLEQELEFLKDEFSTVVIRVWDENLPAINLYKKLGFKIFGSPIQQEKIHQENHQKFIMNKVYLKKRIEANES